MALSYGISLHLKSIQNSVFFRQKIVLHMKANRDTNKLREISEDTSI